jgi:two-component system, LytTR family, response regulator
MSSIKIALIDDSPISTKAAESLIKKHCPETQIVGSFNCPEKALSQLTRLKPDLLLLDIEMPGMTGFQLLEKYKSFKGGVIFVTAHSHYAMQAFKFSAIDYLLKPLKKGALITAIEKFKKTHQSKPAADKVQELAANMDFMSQGTMQKIAVATFDGIEIVRIAEVDFLEARGNYTCIRRNGKDDLLASKTLKDFEGILGDSRFLRIHNTFLINMDKVARYVRADGGHAEMEDGTKIAISRRHKEKFLQSLKA